MRRLLVLLIAASVAVFAVARAQTDEEIPLPITETIQYEVGLGDTLDRLGATFDVDVACLIEDNEIENANLIFIGQVLTISVDCGPYFGGGFVAFPRPLAIEEQGGGGPPAYVVRVSDTLDTIAQTFNVSVISLQEFNEIEDPLLLLPGTVIFIPPGAPAYGELPPLPGVSIEQGGGGDPLYVVQPGDTLDTIAQFYNVRVGCVAVANNLENPGLIFPRATLLIPSDCPEYDGTFFSGRILDEDRTQNIPTVTPVPPTPEGGALQDQLDATPTQEGPTFTPMPSPTLVPTLPPVTVFPTETVPPIELGEEAEVPIASPTPEGASVPQDAAVPEDDDDGGFLFGLFGDGGATPTPEFGTGGAGGGGSAEVGAVGSDLNLIETLEEISEDDAG